MRYRIRNARNGKVLATRVAVASGFRDRFRGLLGRTALPDEEALFIPHCRSIHTCFMKFPIDVVFVREGHIIGLTENLRPFRIFSVRGGGVDTLELAGSRLRSSDTRLGDRIQWESY